ncbi:hypothetical protein H7097_00975 [Aeromicrobium sp.]|nr:hypothetical protein [Candidatus Saccharibacteria bacterium]
MKNLNQKAFAVPEALLVIVIISMLAGTGYFVWNAKQNTDESLDKSANANQAVVKPTVANSEAKLSSYQDTIGKFSFSYPSNWTTHKTITNKDSSAASSIVTVTDPSGKAVLHFGADQGGRGGDCQPKATDKPFMAGNDCNSRENLSTDLLDIKNVYYAKEQQNTAGKVTLTYEPTSVVLVTYHFADGGGKQMYGMGVTNSNPGDEVLINKPAMGYVGGQDFVTVYDSKGSFKPNVYAYTNGADKNFLTNDNAGVIKAIFHSLAIATQ